MTALNSEGLLPCPFCLNELAVVRDYDGDPLYAHPDSENCVLSGSAWDKDTFEVAAWNRRPTSTDHIADAGEMVATLSIEGLPHPDDVIRWNAAAAASAVNVLSDSQGLSALPPVDGLEVVAERLRAYRPLDEWGDPERHSICDEAAEALSQASSVIVGLTAERDAAQASAFVWANRFVLMDGAYNREFSRAQAAEARISSLEEENKRLREALRPFAFQGLRVDLDRFDGETQIEVHFPRVSPRKAIPCGFVYVEDVLAARQTLGDHNG